MTNQFFVKKYKQQKGTINKTPLFVYRRPKLNKKDSESFQVRYAGLCKTFSSVDISLTFVEKLLNNKLDEILSSDIILSVVCSDKDKEIRVVTKGIDKDDAYFFSEKYGKYEDLDYQVETFTASCCMMWKLHFMKFNTDYRLSLLRRNWIGHDNVNRTANHFPYRIHAQTPKHGSTGYTNQLFR